MTGHDAQTFQQFPERQLPTERNSSYLSRSALDKAYGLFQNVVFALSRQPTL